jgi:hypothetical protein
LKKSPEPAKAREKIRTVTGLNFIAASDMGNYPPSDSHWLDGNVAEIAHAGRRDGVSACNPIANPARATG